MPRSGRKGGPAIFRYAAEAAHKYRGIKPLLPTAELRGRICDLLRVGAWQ